MEQVQKSFELAAWASLMVQNSKVQVNGISIWDFRSDIIFTLGILNCIILISSPKNFLALKQLYHPYQREIGHLLILS